MENNKKKAFKQGKVAKNSLNLEHGRTNMEAKLPLGKNVMPLSSSHDILPIVEPLGQQRNDDKKNRLRSGQAPNHASHSSSSHHGGYPHKFKNISKSSFIKIGSTSKHQKSKTMKKRKKRA